MASAQARSHDFDAERARKDLREMASAGPRLPGSEAKREVVALFVERLRQAGLRTEVQALDGNLVQNVVGETTGTAQHPRLVVLIAHYDSSTTITEGSSDTNCGLSGAAALLEEARVLGAHTWSQSLLIALVDGHYQLEADSGARALVESLERSGRLAQVAGVVAVDRFGFAKFEVASEVALSREFRDELENDLFALDLKDAFRPDNLVSIAGSHDPFRARGVRAVFPLIGRAGEDEPRLEAFCDQSADLLRTSDLSILQNFGDLLDRIARRRLSATLSH